MVTFNFHRFNRRRDHVRAVSSRSQTKSARRIGLLLLLFAAAIAVILLGANTRTRHLAINSLWLSCGTCLISLPVGIVLSLLITRTDVPGRQIAMAALGSLLFVPLYLQCAGWQAAVGAQGWYTLGFSSLDAPPLLAGWHGALWVHAIAAIPWVVLIVGGTLIWVDPALEESALLDAKPWKVICLVTLPQSLGGAFVAGLWIFITTAGEITVTDLFAVHTLARDLYAGFYLGDTMLEAEIGMLPGVCLFVVALLAAWLLSDRVFSRSPTLPVNRLWIFRLNRWRLVAAILLGCALLIMVGVPVASLVYKAGVTVEQFQSGRMRTWSLEKCLQTIGLGDDLLRPFRRHAAEFYWTFGIGGLAATAAVAIATGCSWVARRSGALALAVMLLAAGLFALPGPVVGQGIIALLNQRELSVLTWLYDRSILAPWLAMLIRCLPLCILIMWHALRTIPSATLDSAEIDGASAIRRVIQVAIPQRIPAIACAWTVAMAIAIGDLGTVIQVVPPGVDLLSVRIFGLLHAGVENEVAGICLVNFAIVAVIAWATVHLGRLLDG